MKTFFLFLALAFITISCKENAQTNIVTPETSIIPEGATSPHRYVTNATPPDSFTAGIFKIQAATLSPNATIDTAEIIIDYMRVYEKDNTTGVETLIAFEEYSGGPFPLDGSKGGLWDRLPYWYPPGDLHTSIDASSIQGGYLYLNIKTHRDKIYLWWAPMFAVSSNKTYLFETKVKIVGKTSLQLGMDWWRSLGAPANSSNIKNGFMGEWYGANSDFTIIKEKLP